MQLFFKLSKFIPYDCYRSVFNIDYNKLYEDGKRIILMDIDNTLIPYDEHIPNQGLIDLFIKIQAIGFEIIFISNNHKRRVGRFARAINARYVSDAWKPFKNGYKKALKIAHQYSKSEIITIGDQLMTDILGSNRMGIDAILVKAIKKKNEKWFTKLNRKIEHRILNKLKIEYPDAYLKLERIYKDEK